MISLLIIYINAFLSSMQAIFGPMSDIRRLDDFQENYVGCDTVNKKCVLESAFQSITITSIPAKFVEIIKFQNIKSMELQHQYAMLAECSFQELLVTI